MASAENESTAGSLVRLVVISDTHNRHFSVHKLLPTFATADNSGAIPSILVHCGDFADRGNLRHVRSFCRWLAHCGDDDDDDESHDVAADNSSNNKTKRLPGLPSCFRDVVVVGGNHDISLPSSSSTEDKNSGGHGNPHPDIIDLEAEFDKCNHVLQQNGVDRRVHFLRDHSVTVAGVITFYGSSWEASVRDDFSNLSLVMMTTTTGAVDDADAESHNHGGSVPPDVIVSHLIPRFSSQERRVARSQHQKGWIDFAAWRHGSRVLVLLATRHKIPLVLSGHVHWGRGAVFIPYHQHEHKHQQQERGGENNNDETPGTWFVNASSTKPGCGSPSKEVDPDLEVTAPVVIDYDWRNRRVARLSCPGHQK